MCNNLPRNSLVVNDQRDVSINANLLHSPVIPVRRMLIASGIIERDNENNIVHGRVANSTNDIGVSAPLAFWKRPTASIISSILRLLGPVSFLFLFPFFPPPLSSFLASVPCYPISRSRIR